MVRVGEGIWHMNTANGGLNIARDGRLVCDPLNMVGAQLSLCASGLIGLLEFIDHGRCECWNERVWSWPIFQEMDVQEEVREQLQDLWELVARVHPYTSDMSWDRTCDGKNRGTAFAQHDQTCSAWNPVADWSMEAFNLQDVYSKLEPEIWPSGFKGGQWQCFADLPETIFVSEEGNSSVLVLQTSFMPGLIINDSVTGEAAEGDRFGTAPDLRGFPCAYPSARLSTRETRAFRPPLKLEVRARLPIGPGLGALVSLKPKHVRGFRSYPYTGVVFVLDACGNSVTEEHMRTGIVSGPFPRFPHDLFQRATFEFPSHTDSDCCWRTYEFEWTLGRMVFTVDGVTAFEFDNYFPSLTFETNEMAEFPEPFTGEWYLDVELVVSDDISPPLSGSAFNDLSRRRFEIDHIRSYSCAS